MLSDLETKGYTIFPGVLTEEEIKRSKNLFHNGLTKFLELKTFTLMSTLMVFLDTIK